MLSTTGYMRTNIFPMISFIRGLPALSRAFLTSWTKRDEKIRVRPGKTAVLITGCDSGLGYSFARHCQDFYGLIIIACCLDPSGEGASRLAKDYPKGIHIVKLDLLSPESIDEMRSQVAQIAEKHGYEIHAVVNNAGVMTMGEFEWLTHDQIFEMVFVNLVGAMKVTKNLLPYLRETRGRVLNISSHCSLASMPGLSVYGATKTALEAWSTALRMELEKYQVDVVTLIPGSYVTESLILKGVKASSKKMWDTMSDETKKTHEGNFNRFYEYLGAIPVPKLSYIHDEALFEKFDGALLNTRPKRQYVHGPLRYRFYFFLFSISPTVKIKEYLIKKFVNLPGF
uniref:Estradiol 17-beta-dehydrogenase 2 n=1 Tax=Lygus hesperus TaxID=30085 RepID=A0A146KVZ1_LYGHE